MSGGRRSGRAWPKVLLGVGLLGCVGPFARDEPGTTPPDPSYGVRVVEAEGVFEFYERARIFYERMALRRFNTLSTYRDEVLRDFFRTESAYADYYADLAQALEDADFERSRPLSLDVVEFELEGPGQAQVTTRIIGDDGRPLRWGRTRLERIDRWERIQGEWWIVPQKL